MILEHYSNNSDLFSISSHPILFTIFKQQGFRNNPFTFHKFSLQPEL